MTTLNRRITVNYRLPGREIVIVIVTEDDVETAVEALESFEAGLFDVLDVFAIVSEGDEISVTENGETTVYSYADWRLGDAVMELHAEDPVSVVFEDIPVPVTS
jgi:hypothetical protein